MRIPTWWIVSDNHSLPPSIASLHTEPSGHLWQNSSQVLSEDKAERLQICEFLSWPSTRGFGLVHYQLLAHYIVSHLVFIFINAHKHSWLPLRISQCLSLWVWIRRFTSWSFEGSNDRGTLVSQENMKTFNSSEDIELQKSNLNKDYVRS